MPLAALMFASLVLAPAQQSLSLYRWWPRFPVPREVIVVPFAGDAREGMVLESLAGLAARATRRGEASVMLWESLDNDGYVRWFGEWCAEHRPAIRWMSLDEAVSDLHARGLVTGYILYRWEPGSRPLHSAGALDTSANAATMLCGSRGALAVCEELEDRFAGLGLPLLADVRGITEEECLRAHDAELSRDAVCLADPKARNVRSLAIALDLPVVSGVGPAYAAALARCPPDSPVLGWGCGSEDGITTPSSRAGLFQTATNWCHNLPLLASDDAAAKPLATRVHRRPDHAVDPLALDWGAGKHFVNFTLTDGDNIQWLMGNFMGGSESRSYYGDPTRGSIPFTWGIPGPGLALLSPRTLAEVMTAATPRDDFILYSGGGYFYPDLYGADRGSDEALRLHAQRLRAYCDLTGVRILAFNFMDWDSDAAVAACRVFATTIPGLLGIFAFQYYPYCEGNGRVLWVDGAGGDRVPIVSCRLTVWAHTGRPRDTTPAGVAAQLNSLPRAGEVAASDDCFSWVLVHAWSYFRPVDDRADLLAEERGVAEDGSTPGSERGYQPAVWTARRLTDGVAPCSAEELLWRIRLRLDTRRTLASLCMRSGMADLVPRIASVPDVGLPAVYAEMRARHGK